MKVKELKSKIIQFQGGCVMDGHANEFALMVLCEDGSIWGKMYFNDLEWINIALPKGE